MFFEKRAMHRYISKIIVLFFVAGLMSCGTGRKGSKVKEQVVPITINIRGNEHELRFVNMDIYRFKLINALEQFQRVDLELVAADENPEVILDLNITSLLIWPKEEQTSRRVFRRNVVVGTNAQGNPIYQTVTATVDITQTRIRSNATFKTKLTFKTPSPSVFERSFYPRYAYQNIEVGNIQGDRRAVDPSIMTAGDIVDPTTDDILLALSREEMTGRLSQELRRKYK